MVDIISAAKDFKWLTFPTLNTHSTYTHALNQEVDFQVILEENSFVGFNKGYGIEILRTGIANGNELVKSISKHPTEGISCGAVSKVSAGELAVGMKNGFIRLFSASSNAFTGIQFKPDKPSEYNFDDISLNYCNLKKMFFSDNSVTSLDYSCCNGYLAAVYDNADVSVFGLKTGIKTDTVRLDGL